MLRNDQLPSAAVEVRALAKALPLYRSIWTVAPETGPLGPVTVPVSDADPAAICGGAVVFTPGAVDSVSPAKPGGRVLGGGGRATVVSGGANDKVWTPAEQPPTKNAARTTAGTARLVKGSTPPGWPRLLQP